MEPVQKYTYRQMQHSRDPAINQRSFGHLTFDKGIKNIHWKRQTFQHIVIANYIDLQNNENRSISFTLHKNQLKLNQRP